MVLDQGTVLTVATHVGVAVVTSGMALLLLAANARRGWNHWLAFFLLLVAGNFAFNAASEAAVVAAALPADALVEHTLSPDAAVTWRLFDRLAFLMVIFDPAVLAYFACIFPRRGGLATHPLGPALLAVPVVGFTLLAVGTDAFAPPASFGPQWVAFAAYLAACYAYASVRIVRSWLDERGGVMGDQLRWVAFGFLVAIVPRIGLVAMDLRVEPSLATVALDYALRFGVLWGAAALLLRATAEASRAERGPQVRGVVRWTVAVYLVFSAMWAADLVIRAAPAEVAAPYHPLAAFLRHGLTFPIRWFVFAAAMGYGIVRFQLLAVDPTASRRAAAVGGGIVAGAAAGAAAVWGGPAAAGVAAGAAALACMAAVAFLAEPSRNPGYLHRRGLEVYRALLAANRATPSNESTLVELARARSRLGITQGEHDALVAIGDVEEATNGTRSQLIQGRYRVVRRLGAGGSASVYLAHDAERRELVVLKRLHPGEVGDGEDLRAALREVDVARRVTHPNVLAIHDCHALDDGALVVAEYAEGGSLRDLLHAQGRLSVGEAERVLRGALSGLAALHDAGVWHGDVKPENILTTRDGTVKVADFGTARLARRAGPRATVGFGAGTPAYMAPEMTEGAGPTAQADLFGIAAIAHELLTGQGLKWNGHEPRAGRSFPGLAPCEAREWSTWIGWGLERDPARRPTRAVQYLASMPGGHASKPLGAQARRRGA